MNFNFFDLFWVFLAISSLQPLLQRRQIEFRRIQAIKGLEQERKSRVILLIHRQESLSLLGIPLSRYITIEDSEQILRAIRLTPPDVPIDLILHTPGGLVLATEQIARALIRHPAKVTVFVPHYAMSGGTMLALAADEIVMDANAVLGPVDPQLGNFPEEATELGMPITVGLPRQIYDLMELYPQPQGGRPTVQYISMPYGPMRPVLPEPKGRPLPEAGSTSEK